MCPEGIRNKQDSALKRKASAGGGTPRPPTAAAPGGKPKPDQRLEAMQKKIKELEARLEASNSPVPAAQGAMEVEGVDDPNLDGAIVSARENLRYAQGTPEVVRGSIPGGYEAWEAKLKADLDRALAAKRATAPPAAQVAQAERHQATMAKKVDKAVEEFAELEKEQLELTARLEQGAKKVEEAKAALARATQEVRELAARVAAPPAVAAGTEGAAVPEEMVKLSEVLAWQAQVVEEYDRKMAEVAAVLAAHGEQASSPEGDAASVASELIFPEDLEDDAAWAKIDRSKRKAFLRKGQDVLASKVRDTLGKPGPIQVKFRKK